MQIERIGMAEPRPMASPAEMMAAMDWAGDFVTGLMRDKPDLTYTQTEELDPNVINSFPSERRHLAIRVTMWRLIASEDVPRL